MEWRNKLSNLCSKVFSGIRVGPLLFVASFIFSAAIAWHVIKSPLPARAAPTAIGQPLLAVLDSPSITIAAATATSSPTPTAGAHEAQIQWTFGTVTGSYGTCTVQAETSYDGSNYLTLGSAVSVTATSKTINAWTLIEQLGTTSVTSSAVSSSAALGFGQITEFVFACSSYGTTAPVTISVIYR